MEIYSLITGLLIYTVSIFGGDYLRKRGFLKSYTDVYLFAYTTGVIVTTIMLVIMLCDEVNL